MRWIDWLIVFLLIVIGLSCLTMSATWMMSPNSVLPYLHNFLQICLWSAIPIILVAVLYAVIKKRRRK